MRGPRGSRRAARRENPLLTTTYRVPGAVLTERAHSVPLDHSKPDGEKITVFTRELAAPDGLDRPYLLFLQGGPGFEATRPTAPPSGWQKRAIADYRVLLIGSVPRRGRCRRRAGGSCTRPVAAALSQGCRRLARSGRCPAGGVGKSVTQACFQPHR